ncbi:MAG: nucleotidyltransferase domain-containing protein [Nitrospinae bacterium]|nr:nucleotidyltransferase domain-containing protein [Nitrospinota bacterium]
MDEKLKPILTELRRRFESLYGERLVQMVLFGSQARGDAEAGSDIDVLIILRGSVDPGEEITRTGELTASLSLQHDVVISRIFISSEQFTSGQSPLLLNVRREGLPV